MATGTGNLPADNDATSPFQILTSEHMNNIKTNIDALADGSGIGDGALGPDTLAQSAKDVLGSYSTSEIATPYKWVDGKTIYKKTINFGTLPSSAIKRVAHGITNRDTVVRLDGIASTSTNSIPLPYVSTGSNPAQLSVETGDVVVQTGGTALAAYSAHITLWYTKT